WLKTLYRKRAVTWPFIFYTIIWTLSIFSCKYLSRFSKKTIQDLEIFFLNLSQNYHLMSIFCERKE
ncbi:hypothetical protein, partial [Enterococcus faecium]|uniref:hypothetical protein n=1 Tax=Enterococcus faecium TaxID=1352 RepID=UPI001E387CF8